MNLKRTEKNDLSTRKPTKANEITKKSFNLWMYMIYMNYHSQIKMKHIK